MLNQNPTLNKIDSSAQLQDIPVVEEYEEWENFSYDGFQVVRREFFAHLREPSIAFSNYKVAFNSACVNRLPDVEYIQFLVNPDKKILAVRPCQEEDRDSFKWSKTKGDKKYPRSTTCKMFFAKLASLMNWNPDYRYKLLGKIVTANGQLLIVFDLTATEVFHKKEATLDNPHTSRIPVYPLEWQNQFGLPFPDHQKSLQVDIFDGYAVYGYKSNAESDQSCPTPPASDIKTEGGEIAL